MPSCEEPVIFRKQLLASGGRKIAWTLRQPRGFDFWLNNYRQMPTSAGGRSRVKNQTSGKMRLDLARVAHPTRSQFG
jgi:hypothetical protein